MSTVFNVVCAYPCEEKGPRIARKPAGTSLWDSEHWSAFLIEHEHHDLRLEHE